MPMTGAGLWAARKAAIAAVTPVQGTTSASVSAYRDAVGQADSQAIIDYIKANAVVTVTGVQGGASSVNGTVSA